LKKGKSITSDRLREMTQEILEKLHLDYYVLSVFELQDPPEGYEGVRVWCVIFSEDIDDLVVVLDRNSTERTARDQIHQQLHKHKMSPDLNGE
jgi:hypothetical protein